MESPQALIRCRPAAPPQAAGATLAAALAAALLSGTAVSATELPSAPLPATAQPPAQTSPGSASAQAAARAPDAALQEDPSTYGLPFFGAEAIKAGASLPLPIGIAIIGQYQREDIRAHDLQVGLGSGPLINADFVNFTALTTRVRNLIFRADLWLFPFFNVYGLAGESWASTTSTLNRPINLPITTDTQGATFGFGGTLAWGLEGIGFVSLDANLTWADQDILTVPARTLTFTPRLGHRWRSDTVAGRAFTLWAGATLEDFENANEGSVSLGGALPSTAGGGSGIMFPSDFGTWLAGLTRPQQQAVTALLNELLVIPNFNDARASFKLNINPAKAWNLVVGGSMDLSKRWQLVAEAGLLGARTSVMGNLAYRFGI